MSIKMMGLEQLRARVVELRARLTDLAPAYKRAAIVVMGAAQMRIRTKNSGTWTPEKRYNPIGSLLYRTGALYRSVMVGGDGNIYEKIPGGVRVGTGINTPNEEYSIGELMQYGTKHIPARPFLFIDGRDAQNVRTVFSKYIFGGQA